MHNTGLDLVLENVQKHQHVQLLAGAFVMNSALRIDAKHSIRDEQSQSYKFVCHSQLCNTVPWHQHQDVLYSFLCQ